MADQTKNYQPISQLLKATPTSWAEFLDTPLAPTESDEGYLAVFPVRVSGDQDHKVKIWIPRESFELIMREMTEEERKIIVEP